MKRKKRHSLVNMMGARQSSPRTKAGAKWLSKVKKGQVAPKGLHLAHELLDNYVLICSVVYELCSFFECCRFFKNLTFSK